MRAKSCCNCRAAKTRCSLGTPCARCSHRHLDCDYGTAQPRNPEPSRHAGFRPILPAAVVASSGGLGHVESSPLDALASLPGLGFDADPMTDTLGENDISAVAPCSTLVPQLLWVPAVDSAPLETSALQGLGAFGVPPIGSFAESLLSRSVSSIPLSTSRSSSAQLSGRLNSSVEKTLSNYFMTNVTSHEQALSQRLRTIQQGSFTAKMLISQIAEYPRMMASGSHPPPFIHPPCVIGHGPGCPPDSPHSCLPEVLAVCTSLVQMFYARTPGSSGFAWEQIYAHVNRLHAEVGPILVELLLQALRSSRSNTA